MSKMLRSLVIRGGLNVFKQVQRSSSSATTVAVTSSSATEKNVDGETKNTEEKRRKKGKSAMVSAAFSSLKHNQSSSSIDERILEAKLPEELLVLSQETNLSRQQALRIVTTLAEWSVNGQADMSRYETDPRFVSLCQLLGKTTNTVPTQAVSKHGDLSVVLGVTGEDEAAKLISTITLPQMIKVLNSLASKKRRSIPLLRSLAFNIGKSPIKLDIKQGADVLYSLASLNYPDDVLLEKVSSDILDCIAKCEKSSVVGSICTSFGLLRYKDTELLDMISKWIIDHKSQCRCQDIVSLLITLATVNHIPAVGEEFFESTIKPLSSQDMPSSLVWLDFVWSLTVLGQATPDHFKSVLSDEFSDKLTSSLPNDTNYSWKRKILNINGVAKLMKAYKGPFIEASLNFPIVRNKEKQVLVNSVLDALSNLLPSSTFLRTNIDTGMGFIIDGECLIDSKMTPLPVVDKKTGLPVVIPKASRSKTKKNNGTRIAIMVWDYHDKTRGRSTLNGQSALSSQLLISMGYKILSVPYSEYNPREKLTLRVQYLERQIKSIVQSIS